MPRAATPEPRTVASSPSPYPPSMQSTPASAASALRSGADGATPTPDLEKALAPPAGTPVPPAPGFPEFASAQSWLALLAGFLVMTSVLGFATSWSVFESFYYDRLPWGGGAATGHVSQSAISWIGTLQLWGTFGFGLPAGMLMSRFGATTVMAAGTVFSVLGTMMASIAKTFPEFVLAQGLCCAIGFGLVFLPAGSLVNHYFFKHRGLANAMVACGTAAGGVFWPVMIDQMLNQRHISLGWTLRTAGFIQLALLSVATLCLKERLPPGSMKGQVGGALRLYFADKATLAGVCALLLGWFGIYVPYIYITPYGVSRGVAFSMAFYYPSILNGISLVTRVLGGLVADRLLGALNTLVFASVLSAVMAFCWPSASSNAAIVVWTAFYGLTTGTAISLMAAGFAKLAPRRELIPLWLGFTTSFGSLAALASGPVAGKILMDGGGDWRGMAFFAGAFLMASGVAFGLARWFHNPHAWKV